ncbi:MAG: hypothetical protein ACLQEI_18315 [Terriglobales bacterium]
MQSLETLLRVYLLKAGSAAAGNRVAKKPYWDLVVGDIVDDDEFSNYDTLGKLVAKYNLDITKRESSLCVDPQVIAVRDLLAHGRIAAAAADTASLKVVKFDNPQGGKAVVSASVLMDDDWFDTNIANCMVQIENVSSAIQQFAS